MPLGLVFLFDKFILHLTLIFLNFDLDLTLKIEVLLV